MLISSAFFCAPGLAAVYADVDDRLEITAIMFRELLHLGDRP